MFKAIFIVLCVSAILVIFGTLLLSIPCCIYCFPYFWWIAGSKNKAKYKEIAACKSVLKNLRYATILYKHWIFKKELTL